MWIIIASAVHLSLFLLANCNCQETAIMAKQLKKDMWQTTRLTGFKCGAVMCAYCTLLSPQHQYRKHSLRDGKNSAVIGSYFLNWNFLEESCFVVFFMIEWTHNSSFRFNISVYLFPHSTIYALPIKIISKYLKLKYLLLFP